MPATSARGPRYEREEYLPYEKSLDTAAKMNQINQHRCLHWVFQPNRGGHELWPVYLRTAAEAGLCLALRENQ
jgi:hypothetical protein